MIILPLKLMTDWFNFKKKSKDDIEEVRQRLYDNLQPEMYFDGRGPQQRFNEAVLENKKEHNINYDTPRDVVWAKYLNRKKLHNNKYQLVESKYRPTKGATNATYYKHPVLASNTPEGEKKRKDFNQLLEQYVDRIDMGHNVVSNFELNDVFGDYTIGKGYDPEKGTYMSYFDLWDVAPLNTYGPDESHGIGNPVRFYDRVYLDDLYDADDNFEKKSIWLPNVIVRGKTKKHKEGGNMQYFKGGKKIHIKESQKGSFTKYCGGNVTSECIARGKASPDPKIRKKATFAANARKWKHQDGGTIDYKNINVDEEALNPYGKFTFNTDKSYDELNYIK